MSCCSVRVCCWIVAVLFTIFAPLGAIYCIFVLCISAEKKRELIENYDILQDEIFYFYLVGAVYCLMLLASTIALIVGLKKSRPQLLFPFLIVMMLGGLYLFIRIIMIIVRGVRAEYSFGEIAMEALPYLIIALFHGLLRAPVHILRGRMLKAPYNMPERRDLTNTHYLQRNY